MLPGGLPLDTTVFLPSNTAVQAVLTTMGVPSIDDLLAWWPSLPEEITGRVGGWLGGQWWWGVRGAWGGAAADVGAGAQRSACRRATLPCPPLTPPTPVCVAAGVGDAVPHPAHWFMGRSRGVMREGGGEGGALVSGASPPAVRHACAPCDTRTPPPPTPPSSAC